MAFRLYITPAIGNGNSNEPQPWTNTTGPYRPKYFDGLRYSGIHYGFQPTYLVGADLPGATDTAIAANADVFAFPFNLQATLSNAQATNARAAFAAALIPEQWVNASMLWLQVARTVAGMFAFMRRLAAVIAARTGQPVVFIDASSKLNIQFGSLPVENQQDILAAASSLGHSINVAPNTQLRQVLKDLADQWASTPFPMNEFTF
jgi:hypothetical protein